MRGKYKKEPVVKNEADAEEISPTLPTPKAVTLSGRPVTEPLDPAPKETPGRQQVEGICTGKALINPRIIVVDVPGRGRIAVFVRDPKNFIKGMTVRAYRDTNPGTPSQWFLNSPLPRFRGRY